MLQNMIQVHPLCCIMVFGYLNLLLLHVKKSKLYYFYSSIILLNTSNFSSNKLEQNFCLNNICEQNYLRHPPVHDFCLCLSVSIEMANARKRLSIGILLWTDLLISTLPHCMSSSQSFYVGMHPVYRWRTGDCLTKWYF